jgi:transposase
MLTLSEGTKVFVNLTPTDMRKSINGLSAMILDVFSKAPQSKHLFLFYNKTRNKVKLIFWDKNGFVLYYKQMEKGKFKLNHRLKDGVLEINENELQWLLAGLDFQRMSKFNELNYETYY